jgi:hypothetical protein
MQKGLMMGSIQARYVCTFSSSSSTFKGKRVEKRCEGKIYQSNNKT